MKHKKINIVFISHQGHIEGGADRVLSWLLSGIDRDIYEPLVLLPRQASLAARLDAAQIPYLVVPYRGWVSNSKNWLGRLYRIGMNIVAVLRLFLRLRHRKIDVIYSNSLYTPIGAVLARLLKVPHIWHVHELVAEGLLSHYDLGSRRSLSFVNRVSNAVICNAVATSREIASYVTEDKLHIIYCGIKRVDELQALSIHERVRRPVRLTILGSVEPHKRQEDAIRALAILRDYGVDSTLQIVGEMNEPYTTQLRSLTRELNIEDSIQWLGFVEDIGAVYENTDIKLLCSQAESFGLVVVEAMAAGRPVVATNTGGVAEIIEDGVTGFLYTPGDYQTLVELILNLITDKQLYNEIAIRARQSVRERFTMDKFLKDIGTVIQHSIVTFYEH